MEVWQISDKRLDHLKERLQKHDFSSYQELSLHHDLSSFLRESLALIEREAKHVMPGEDYRYFLELFPLYLEISKTSSIQEEEFRERLKLTKDALLYAIHDKKDEMSEEIRNIFKESLDSVDLLDAIIAFSLPVKDQEDLGNFLLRLATEPTQFVYFEQILTKYPFLVRFQDREGLSLFGNMMYLYQDAVFSYIDHLDASSLERIVHLDRVLCYIQEMDHFEMPSFTALENLWHDLAHRYEEKDLFLSKEASRKLLFWERQQERFFENEERFLTSNELRFKYDFPLLLKKENKKETAAILRQEVTSNAKAGSRRTLKMPIFTIDGCETACFDDAFSVEKTMDGSYLLGIHITDILASLPLESKLYQQAKTQTTAIYLPSQTMPMFPKKLLLSRFSLTSNAYRYAKSFFVQLSSKGEIETFWFENTIIKVDRNFSYQEVNQIISDGNTSRPVLAAVVYLNDALYPLSRMYAEDKYYRMATKDVSNITGTNITGSSRAEDMVRLGMLLPNTLVPMYFSKNHLPFIYRVHDVDLQILEALEEMETHTETGSISYSNFLSELKKLYPRPFYSTENIGHAGLHAPFYSHLTSPARRFADIYAHLCLDQFYFKNPTDNDYRQMEQALQEAVVDLNARTFLTEQYVKEWHKMKYLRKQKKALDK